MRQVKRWRYYCDFCNKAGGQKYAMEKHERGCTKNPSRCCGLCDKAGLDQAPMETLRNAFDEGGMGKLREVSENCPACILATIRSYLPPKGKGSPDPEDWIKMDTEDFDFKKELDEFWQNYNDEQNGH